MNNMQMSTSTPSMEWDPDYYSRYAAFHILDGTYKVVSGHSIGFSVLVPKALITEGLPSGPRPLLVRFHAGGWIAASRLYPDYFSHWQLELSVRHSALVVTPDYRMLPESSLDELMQDIEDFWDWIQTELPGFVRNRTNGAVEVDLSRIITSGESAGGFLSLITGLNHPDGVKSVMAAYPVVDVRSSYFTEDYEKPVFGLPQLSLEMVKEHVDKVQQGKLPLIVSSDPRGERIDLMFAFIQRGCYRQYFPPSQRENAILERLEDGSRFPKGGVFVMHGKDDTVVPVEGSLKLQKVLSELDPELGFRLAVRDGEHGFDGAASLDEEWLADGLDDVVSSWLA